MICKTCGKDKPPEEFNKHADNRTGRTGSCKVCMNIKRSKRDKKYTYFYELTKGDDYQEGRIRAHDKDKAYQIVKARFFGWNIEKLCTFKYKDQPIVKARKGSRK